MKVLMVEPEKTAYEIEIGKDLASMQKAVGGYIEAVYPYEESVAVVCNEEGKLEGLPLNRALRDDEGKIYDIVAGTFFVCGLSEDSFDSLSPELMEKFKKKFYDPEMFINLNGKIQSMKIPEKHIAPRKQNEISPRSKSKKRHDHER